MRGVEGENESVNGGGWWGRQGGSQAGMDAQLKTGIISHPSPVLPSAGNGSVIGWRRAGGRAAWGSRALLNSRHSSLIACSGFVSLASQGKKNGGKLRMKQCRSYSRTCLDLGYTRRLLSQYS